MIKFVIYSEWRSGSNMLASILNNHPDIMCFGELFLKRIVKNPDRRLTNVELLERIEHNNFLFLSPHGRRARPLEYLQLVQAEAGNPAFFGFKLMPSQLESFEEQMVSSKEFKKIYLYRSNILAAYSSKRLANATGQGLVRAQEEVIETKIRFDVEDFERYRKIVEKRLVRTRERLDEASPNGYLDTEYRKICKPEGVLEVINYIGADASSHSIDIGTKKRNTSRIVDRFENPEDAVAHLEEIERLDWVEETH